MGLLHVCTYDFTPHCWGRLVFLWSLHTIHSSHQSLEQIHWFEATFKMFGRAIRGWILWLRPRNFLAISESLVANLKKVRQTWFQSSDLFDFDIFLFCITYKSWVLVFEEQKKDKKSELWNGLSYRGLSYFFEVVSRTFRAR